MAIPKKKMAGKPAMKKAKDGKELANVTVRPSFGQNFKSSMKKFMTTDSTDYQNTPAKTTAGKILRGANKVASVAARVASAPVAAATSALSAGVKSVDNAIKTRKEINAIKKNGGKISKKMSAPKMMMKKTTSKKKK